MSHFDRFLSDVTEDATPKAPQANLTEIDSIVVPAREEGFQETFLKESCWHAIRMHGSMRPQIKYIARYRVAPVSAITHVAPVKSIEPWKDTGKFALNFAEPAKATKPIPMLKQGRVKTFQRTSWAVRSRKPGDLTAEARELHLSAALPHLANMAYRTGRMLQFDPQKERFIGDEEANRLLSRNYRAPYLVREKV